MSACFFSQGGKLAIVKKTDIKVEFGSKIKALRELHNVTQTDLAAKIDVDVRTIRRIESGKYNPTLEIIMSLATAFKTTIPDLFK